jgi:hypothetical protein
MGCNYSKLVIITEILILFKLFLSELISGKELPYTPEYNATPPYLLTTKSEYF